MTVPCPEPGCTFKAKNKAGLGGHRRARHPEPTTTSVLATTLEQLGPKASDPLGAAALRLAQAIDETMSVRELPRLSAELRALLGALGVGRVQVEATPEGDVVDDLSARRRARRADASGDARPAPRQQRRRGGDRTR